MPETIKLRPQRIEAELAAAEADKENRTVPVTFYSGATVVQFNWQNGLHNLVMSMDPKHIRLDRLNTGRAPFTLGHQDANSPDAVLGVIEKGSATIERGKGRAMVRFAKNDPVADSVWNKVEQGILPNVSMEAILYKLKEVTQEGDKIKTFRAMDWEPYAIASVARGADPNAHFSASESVETECEIELAELDVRATALEEHTMDEQTITNAGDLARTDQSAIHAAVAAEKNRATAITEKAAKLGLAELGAQHVAAGSTFEQFVASALDAIVTRQSATESRVASASITRDERDTRVQLAEQVLFRMVDTKAEVDGQNPFRGMRLSRLCEELLTRQGVNVRGKTVPEIATLSMHNTADFPNILENTARKMMLSAYSYAQPSYRQWAKASTAPDFKTMSRLRLSETPTLLKVAEGAQITLGTMSESKETYAIATYGRGLSFTRQMIINDDLGAFNDLVSAFGVQVARLENKTVYGLLTANANMSDSIALFHASHNNLGAGVIGDTALDNAVTAMAKQTGLDGATILNLEPRFLIVPKAKDITARRAMLPVNEAVKAADRNMFAGRFTVVSDAELDGTSTIEWYMAADPSVAPGIEYAFLEGAQGPQVLRKENEDAILGIQIYVYEDFGAKAVDFRSLYKSSGS